MRCHRCIVFVSLCIFISWIIRMAATLPGPVPISQVGWSNRTYYNNATIRNDLTSKHKNIWNPVRAISNSISLFSDEKSRNVKRRLSSLVVDLPDYSHEQELTLPLNGEHMPLKATFTATNSYCYNIEPDRFSVRMDTNLEIRSISDSYNRLDVTYNLNTVQAEVELSTPLDKSTYDTLRLGTHLNEPQLFPCLLAFSYDFDSPWIDIQLPESVSSMRPSGGTQTNVDVEELNAVVGYISSTGARALVHESLTYFLMNAECPRMIDREIYLDFRDFLLPAQVAKDLGGYGTSPYGNAGRALHAQLNGGLTAANESGILKMNEVFGPLTERQSGVPGAIIWEPFFAFDTGNTTGDFFDALKASSFSRYEFAFSGLRLWNIDTIVTPSKVLEPTNQDYTLENFIKFGVPGRPITFAVRASLNADARNSTYKIRNEVDFKFSMESLELFMEILSLIPTSGFFEMPMKDVTNLYCWFALVSIYSQNHALREEEESSPLEAFDIPSFISELIGLSTNITCIGCTNRAFYDTLPRVTHAIDKSEVKEIWVTRAEKLLKEVVLSDLIENIIQGYLFQSRMYCPHQPEYTVEAAQEPFNFSVQIEELPPLTREALDSMMFTCLVVFQIAVVIIAELFDESNAILEQQNITGTQTYDDIPEGTEMVEWEELSNDPLVGVILSEMTQRFFTPNNVTGDLGVNEVLTELLQMENGIYKIKFVDIDTTSNYGGILLRLDEVEIGGLDSFTLVDFFRPSGPQTGVNEVKLDFLSLSLLISANQTNTADEPNEVRISFKLEDINATIPLYMAIDRDVVSNLTIGSFFNFNDLLPCLLSIVHRMYFPEIIINVGNLDGPIVDGLMTETANAFTTIIDLIYDTVPTKVHDSVSFLFDSIVRDSLNAFLINTIDEGKCPDPPVVNSSEYVDFREIIKENDENDNENKTYDDTFHIIQDTFEKDVLAVDPSTGLSKFNSLVLEPVTKIQSGEEGTIHVPGDIFSVELLGDLSTPNAKVRDTTRIRLYDLRLENVNSIGAPLEIMKQNITSGFLVDNRISIGAGPEPFRLFLKFEFSLEGNPVFNSKNIVQFQLDLDDIAIFTVLFAKIRKKAYVNFPLRYAGETNCWAQLFTTPGGPGVEPGLWLDYVEFNFSSAKLNMTCIECESVAMQNVSSLLWELEDVMDLLFVRFADLGVESLTQFFNLGILDQIVAEAASDCKRDINVYRKGVAAETKLPEYPPLSRQSLETVAFASTVSLLIIMYFMADEQSKYDLSDRNPLYGQDQLKVPEGVKLINFTKPLGRFGDFVDFVNDYWGQPFVDEDGNLDMHVNIMLRQMDHTTVTTEVNIPLSSETWQLVFSEVYMTGIDSFDAFHLINATGPQTVQSNFGWSSLGIELRFLAESIATTADGEISVEDSLPFAFKFEVEDIKLVTSTLLAVDEDKIMNLQLGSVLEVDNFFPCIFEVSRAVEITQLDLTAGKVNISSIKGFDDEDIRETNEELLRVLQDEYGDVLTEALPSLFHVSARQIVNEIFNRFKEDRKRCPRPAFDWSKQTESFVDLRDLFLSEAHARFYGASGLAPYGGWVYNAYLLLDLLMKTDPESAADGMNQVVFEQFEEAATTRQGDYFFPGELFNLWVDTTFVGLDLQFGLKFSDIGFQNVDTIGAPWSILDVRVGEPYIMDNTISIGVGGKPFRINARVSNLIGLGEDENRISNDFDMTVDFHGLTLSLTGFAKIDEKKFMGYPLRNYDRASCWFATIPAPEGGLYTDNVSPTASITSLTSFVEKVNFNITCHNCSTLEIRNLEKDFIANIVAQEITVYINNALNFIMARLKKPFAQSIIDRALKNAHRNCSGSFEPKLPLFGRDPTRHIYEPEKHSFNILLPLILFGGGGFFAAWVGWLTFKVRRRYQAWLETLPPYHFYVLCRQQRVREEIQIEVNRSSRSMWSSEAIPRLMQVSVPCLILGNMIVLLIGHLSNDCSVMLTIGFGGQSLKRRDFFYFSVLNMIRLFLNAKSSSFRTLVVGALGLCTVWPYGRQIATLVLWFLPVNFVKTSTRGKFLSWLEKLAKWSAVEQFTILFCIIALRITMKGPYLSFPPDGLYAVEIKLLPLTGFYANFISQMMSQIILRVVIQYHNRIVYKSSKAYMTKHSCHYATTSNNDAPEEAPRNVHDDEETDIEDQLCKHSFVRLHRFHFDKLVTRDSVNLFIIVKLAVVCIMFVLASAFPMFSFESKGLVGLIQAVADNFEKDPVDYHGVIGIANILMDDAKDAKLLGEVGQSIGLVLISVMFVFCIVFIPIAQTCVLGYMWLLPMNRKRRNSLLILAEILQAWNYSEVFLLTVIFAIWQIQFASDFYLNRICGKHFYNSLDILVISGMIEPEDSQCFRRVAKLGVGCYVMIVALLLLFFLNVFVTRAAKQYLREKEETDIVRLLSQSEVNDPASFEIDNLDSSNIPSHPVLFTDIFRHFLRPELWSLRREHGMDNIVRIAQEEQMFFDNLQSNAPLDLM